MTIHGQARPKLMEILFDYIYFFLGHPSHELISLKLRFKILEFSAHLLSILNMYLDDIHV